MSEPPTSPAGPDPPTTPVSPTWKGSAPVPPPSESSRRRRRQPDEWESPPDAPEAVDPWPPPPPPPEWNPLRPVTAPLPPGWGTADPPARTPRPPLPGRPPPGWPGYLPRPPRRRRRWPWVMLVLTAACCCGCVAWLKPFADQYPTTVATPPEQVAGLVRRSDAGTRATIQELELKVRSQRWLAEDTFAVVYAEPRTNRRPVTVAGATGFLLDPEGDLTGELNRLGVTDVRTVPPGDLGGHQRCGTTQSGTVCGWADHGSIAVGTFAGRDVDDSARLLRELRAVLVTRS